MTSQDSWMTGNLGGSNVSWLMPREQEHYFIEKVPVVSFEDLEASSSYPRVGLIACEMIDRKFVDGREIAIVNTERPCAIESVEGDADFSVFSDQLVEH